MMPLRYKPSYKAFFSKGGFLLRKWNSSEPAVLQHISPELKDSQSTYLNTDPEGPSYKAFFQRRVLLCKWNSSEPAVLQHNSPELKDSQSTYLITDPERYTKTIGIEWNTHMDHFHLTIVALPPLEHTTKHILVFDMAKTFDVLGWFSPTVIKAKILLQQLWDSED